MAISSECSGLIPAHAGKTLPSCDGICGPWAHPRSRGENGFDSHCTLLTTGSSPLTRGKPDDVDGFHVGPGLIPAHAGKTIVVADPRDRSGAHPRSRGENLCGQVVLLLGCGSSPLTRGKPSGMNQLRDAARLIPAHAGKTPRLTGRVARLPAHPRSRGENIPTRGRVASLLGSSPLTRGKRCRVTLSVLCRGLIPAHAGKTYR